MKTRVVGILAISVVILITMIGITWWMSCDERDVRSAPDEFVEKIILKDLAQHDANEKFIEFKLGDIKTRKPWTHFCIIGSYGRGEDIEEHAKQVHVDIKNVTLYNYFDYPGEWSIVYFRENRYFQLSFPGVCLSQYKFNVKCASLGAGIIEFERGQATRECPDGSFSISTVFGEK
jgi:hypothetical protein